MRSRFRYERSPGGLDTVRLQNDCLDLAIVPQAGGKILDLIDRRNGCNWLWKNPHIPVAIAEIPAYWCAHPLLAIEPDSVIGIADNMPLRGPS